MAKFLFTSDIHLTDRRLDEYRWSVFDWLAVRAKAKSVDAIFIIGDLTDAKNRHSAILVNRIVSELRNLSKVCPVHLIKGNHDYQDPKLPFFSFLDEPGISYYIAPETIDVAGSRILVLPHEHKFYKAQDISVLARGGPFDFVLLHQTVAGSVSSNGFKLEGTPSQFLRVFRKPTQLIAGDIHVPQVVGRVTYCGSPHPVAFGDDFKSRVLYWNGEALKSLPRTTIKKAVIHIHPDTDLAYVSAQYNDGDQLKIVFHSDRSNFYMWKDIKQDLLANFTANGAQVFGIELRPYKEHRPVGKTSHRAADTPAQQLAAYCRNEGITQEFLDVGLGYI